MPKPSYFLPDGSPVYDPETSEGSFGGCVSTILYIVGIALLFLIANFLLKIIGAGVYIIPFPKLF